MKAIFLIGCALLSLGELFASPAIARELCPKITNTKLQVQSQIQPQVQGVQTKGENKNRRRRNQNSGTVNFESELLRLTNLERNKQGLASLTLSSQLTKSARVHATDMATNGYFSHTGLNGSTPWDRAKANGYTYSFIGENIAAGSPTPEGTINQWMNSPGHRRNILNPNFREIGFGYANAPNSSYQHYWVQVFGTPQR